uniref:NADAR domain-containing protein n=1 Tax=viral metagenome TaxID=1070528 RepID=A0A6C0BN73_9ZZZZ
MNGTVSSSVPVDPYIFFYGHKGSKDEAVFSQFYPSSFTIQGVTFPTAEHYMHYQKAILFGDTVTAQKILSTSDPLTAKKLGRQVKPFNEQVWNERSMQIVYDGNIAKFTQNPRLLQIITSPKYNGRFFVETNPRDKIWGIGMGETKARTLHPTQWNGQNKLGRVLTAVRDNIITSMRQ